jgi:uncharacterized protein (TIGR03435 family)
MRIYRQMRTVILSVITVAFASAGLGQEFEAVSVKPNKSASNSSHSHTDGGLFSGTNLSLKNLVMSAYGMKDYQVDAPDWLASERFDIAARFPKNLPTEQDKLLAAFQSMMRKMLADRFHLAVHRDRKSFSVYGLLVAKSGIKFKAAPGGGSRSDSDDSHYEGRNITMPKLAEFLSRWMDLPVIDMTSLSGFYDVTLDWTATKNADPNTTVGLTVADAVQEQLGLKLENRKAPIEILIVDHAERVPTEN